MDTLMRMQAAYNTARARRKSAQIRVQRYQPDSVPA
jgi:hypothetical protein